MKKMIAILCAVVLVASAVIGVTNVRNSNRIKDLNADLASMQDVIKENLSKMDALTEEVNQKTEALTAKDAEIETLTADVAEKTERIEALTADVADKEAQIQTLTADVAEKEARIAALNTAVETHAAEIAALTEQAGAAQSQIDAVVAEFLATIPEGADDYTKAKLAYDYIVERASYDHGAAASLNWYDGEGRAPGQTIDDVFLRSSAVCAGYSSAYQYLLQLMGIQCVQVRGVADGVGHAWCIAQLDGAYYQIDPTWGDPQFLDEEFNVGDDYVNYEYLAITTDDISATHMADGTFAIPLCASTEDNYFVREGLLFDWADAGRFGQLVSDAEATG